MRSFCRISLGSAPISAAEALRQSFRCAAPSVIIAASMRRQSSSRIANRRFASKISRAARIPPAEAEANYYAAFEERAMAA
jgi:hypothetical protein